MTSQKSFPSCSRVYSRMCIRKGPLRGKVPNRKNLRCQCSSQGPALRQNGEIYYNPDANSGLHYFFFSSLAERAITAVPVTALQKEAIETSSAMPRIHQAETKQTKEDKTKSNQAKQTTQHQPNTNQSQTPEWKQSSLFLYNIQLK